MPGICFDNSQHRSFKIFCCATKQVNRSCNNGISNSQPHRPLDRNAYIKISVITTKFHCMKLLKSALSLLTLSLVLVLSSFSVNPSSSLTSQSGGPKLDVQALFSPVFFKYIGPCPGTEAQLKDPENWEQVSNANFCTGTQAICAAKFDSRYINTSTGLPNATILNAIWIHRNDAKVNGVVTFNLDTPPTPEGEVIIYFRNCP